MDQNINVEKVAASFRQYDPYKVGRAELMLKADWFTPGSEGRWGQRVHFQGAPGASKTRLNKKVCADWGFTNLTIIAALREPQEFNGIMLPKMKWREIQNQLVFETDGVRREPEQWFHDACAAKRAVITLDEATTMIMATQNALLRFVDEGVIGDYRLPNTVRLVLLSNPFGMVGGYEHNAAMANRQVWLEYPVPTEEEWCDWAIKDGGEIHQEKRDAVYDADAEEERVRAVWPALYRAHRTLFVTFVRSHPNSINRPFPQNESVKGHPTYRSAEKFMRYLASTELHGLDEAVEEMFLVGCAGKELTEEFMAWRADMSLPDTRAWLDGEVTIPVDGSQVDKVCVMFSKAASLLANTKEAKRDERGDKFWQIAEGWMGVASDIVGMAANEVANAGLGSRKYGVKHACGRVLNRLRIVEHAA